MSTLYFRELESHNSISKGMTEAKVANIFSKWLTKNHFQRELWRIADSKLRPNDIICPYYPDFLIKAKGAMNHKIAIEVKGSRFDFPRLLGQLLLYNSYWSEVWAVLPMEKAKELLKIQTMIQRKTPFNFAIFGIKKDVIYRYDEKQKRFIELLPLLEV